MGFGGDGESGEESGGEGERVRRQELIVLGALASFYTLCDRLEATRVELQFYLTRVFQHTGRSLLFLTITFGYFS